MSSCGTGCYWGGMAALYILQAAQGSSLYW